MYLPSRYLRALNDAAGRGRPQARLLRVQVDGRDEGLQQLVRVLRRVALHFAREHLRSFDAHFEAAFSCSSGGKLGAMVDDVLDAIGSSLEESTGETDDGYEVVPGFILAHDAQREAFFENRLFIRDVIRHGGGGVTDAAGRQRQKKRA